MRKFFTADTHYGQTNIVRGVSSWNDKTACRDFSTVSEMNDVIVNNINNTVGEDDELWHLGDWSLGRLYNIVEFRDRVRCKNVYLVLGNHDKEIRSRKEMQSIFKEVHKKHTINIGEHQIVMDHFPNLVWDRHHYGSWHLHGHCHGSLNKNVEFYKRKVLDVGIDTHPEFRPYSFDEIEVIMSKRGISKIDHHRREK